MRRHDECPIDATTLLTAVPGLLGFIPDRSLILIAMSGRAMTRTVMRHDLSLTSTGRPDATLTGAIEHLGQVMSRHEPTAVVAVIADNRYRPGDARYQAVLSLADRYCQSSGGVAQGFVVTDFEEHAPWHLVWQPELSGPTTANLFSGSDVGAVADPHSSPTAVAEAVATGRVVLARRSEMLDMLSPLPHCASGTCAASSSSIGERDPAALLRAALAAIQAPQQHSDCRTLQLLDRAITTIDVRDALLACAVTDLRHPAEAMWRTLARRLTRTGRASAATLLAHLYYLGGEGAYAGVALDCALTADPGWTLAQLLDQALRNGLHPDSLREMIPDSYAIAAGLGVAMPPYASRRAAG